MKNFTKTEIDLIKKKYDKNGWVKIPNFLNKKQLTLTKKRLDSFLKSSKQKYSGRDINFTDSKEVNSFHKMHDLDWVKKFSKKKNLKNFVKVFLKSEPELRASELFAKPKKVGLPAPIHQDNFYWRVKNSNALTIWIALCSSDVKNGGVFYFNGSHKNGLYDHVASFAKGSSQKIKNLNKLKRYKKYTPSLKPGDAIVHHVLVAHGSKRNKTKRPRQGWTLQFKDKKSFYDKATIAFYEKSLKKQLNLRGQ